MERLLNVQTALSLGYVGLMVGTAYVASRVFLPSGSTSVKTRSIFLWLAFDAICHLTLEGSFLYLSLQGRTVNTSSSFFGYLWQEYAAADARWGVADPTVVALEYLTVLGAGPMAAYCCYLLATNDPIYHYWAVVLSTGELYGGFMTFAPEWLTGSPNLDTSNWLLLWMYLALMNIVWVLVPLWLMIDSFGYISDALRASTPAKKASKSAPRKKSSTGGLSSSHGLSGTAYTLLLAVVFFYIMPTASASSVTSKTQPALSLFPTGPFADQPTMLDTLKSLFVPMLLPAMLLGVSLFVGAIQVAESGVRKIKRTNRTRRRKLLQTLGINEKQEIEDGKGPRTILGFFHPYCNAGGGGERVLYEAIRYHQGQDARLVVVIYTGDFPSATKEDILQRAESRFGIAVDARTVALIPLERRWMVEDGTYDRFTLLGQCWGSIWLGFEAMASLIPDVYVDTMGYAFTYPVVRWFTKTVPVGGYVHYPVISTDMLDRVAKREPGHTNAGKTANSRLRTSAKLIYYRLLARGYGWALRRADVLVVNGSWTQNHINRLLTGSPTPVKRSDSTTKSARYAEIVYPPCDTTQLATFPLTAESRHQKLIVSLAQFRPEKEHPTQLHILKSLLDNRPDLFQDSQSRVKLLIMGSSRNQGDQARITLLRALAEQLGVDKYVEFLVNAPFTQVMHHLSTASVGLSTMKDEHFGINVVEFMASGLITLSHKSAGPWMDIAVPTAQPDGKMQPTGFHALSVEEFASTLARILDMDPETEAMSVRQAARQRAVEVFGKDGFTSSWEKLLWEPLIKNQKARAATK